MNRILPGLLFLALACPHAPQPSQPLPPKGTREVVEAAPAKGFHYPYILRIPGEARLNGTTYLLVEPNNTGRVSDDFTVHAEAAKKLATNAIGAYLASWATARTSRSTRRCWSSSGRPSGKIVDVRIIRKPGTWSTSRRCR